MLELQINDHHFYQIHHREGKLWLDDQPVELQPTYSSSYVREFRVGNRAFRAVFLSWDPEQQLLRLRINGKPVSMKIRTLEAQLLERIGVERTSRLQVSELKAPMPGLVRKIHVAAGDAIQANQHLITLEAMKMENVLKAPGDGTIAEVLVSPNATVEKNETLLRFA